MGGILLPWVVDWKILSLGMGFLIHFLIMMRENDSALADELLAEKLTERKMSSWAEAEEQQNFCSMEHFE